MNVKGSMSAMKAWWVNHKQTERQEAAGNYIWSPQRERSGARSQFYANMARVTVGEPIVSFARSKVHRVGRIAGEATTARNPFAGQAAEMWGAVGWYVPVQWFELATAVNPRDHLDEIVPLLPNKYSPIRVNGHGNQKAYLCEISEDLWRVISSHAERQNPGLSAWLGRPVETIDAEEVAAELVQQHERPDPDETTRLQLGKARRGQGLFRNRVLEVERRCRLTGVTAPELLRASHIKPWRVCDTSRERLDGANGLMLSPDADHLFDKGWITFEDDGRVRISPKVSIDDLQRLGLEITEGTNVGPFSADQKKYLAFHRDHVFKPEPS